jgi:hypothetical protein
MLAFQQYYKWGNADEVIFVDRDTSPWTYPTEAACVMGILQIKELLKLSNEEPVSAALVKVIEAVWSVAQETEPKQSDTI